MSFLLIVLVNLIYIPSIFYGLVNDDATAMKLNPYNYKKEKTINIILHTLVAEYIYFAFGCTIPSLIAAILFSIHPMAIQVPVWKSGRHHGHDALIFLIVLAFAPYSGLFYILSWKGYPTLTFTPLLFLFTPYWYLVIFCPLLLLRNWKETARVVNLKIKGNGPFVLALPEEFEIHKWKWRNLIIVMKTFGYYSLACLLPIKNGFYNSFLVTLGASQKDTDYWYSLNRHFWGGLAALVFMGIMWWFNKSNFIGMGILLFGLSIGPYLNFITVSQFTTPRYSYVALIGFQVALVTLAYQSGLVGWLMLAGLGLFYLDRLVRVMKHYQKDNITMILLDSEVFPDNPRLWYYRYEHMLHKNNPIMAFAEASYGLKHLPEDCQLYFGLACACFELGDVNAALKFLETSERFLMLTDRKNMMELITEFRQRIKEKLNQKWITPQKGRFN